MESFRLQGMPWLSLNRGDFAITDDFSSFDTPGHFSRDIRALQHFGKAWYGEKYSGQVDKVSFFHGIQLTTY